MEFVLIFAHQQSEGISDCCLPMHTNALHPDNSQVHSLCTTRVAAAWELLATTEAQNNTGALHYPILASRRMQKDRAWPWCCVTAGPCVFVFQRIFLLQTFRKLPGRLLLLAVAAPRTTKPKVTGAASPHQNGKCWHFKYLSNCG